MKRFVLGAVTVFLVVLCGRSLQSFPSLNGAAPGCSGGGCHTFQAGLVSTLQTAPLQVQVTVTGTTSRVAGELVDSTGVVVASVNTTTSNPFILTAPAPGTYTVNAGFKSPSRRWDSTRVVVSLTDVGEQPSSEVPGDLDLGQNYPNPFNPRTTIRYGLPSAGKVELKVYDARGGEVAVLVDHWQHSGFHAVSWDGSDRPSGVYFYRLTVGERTATRKLLLVK